MHSPGVSLKCMYRASVKYIRGGEGERGRGVCSKACIYYFSSAIALVKCVQMGGQGSKFWLIWAYMVYEWPLIIQAIRQTNTNALPPASWQSCRVKISKFCNLKFWLLLLELTYEKSINKAQLLLLLETCSYQIWKMTFSKWHTQSLNATKIILKQIF